MKRREKRRKEKVKTKNADNIEKINENSRKCCKRQKQIRKKYNQKKK